MGINNDRSIKENKILTNDNFRIVFEGKIVKGADASDVMQRMGKLLNKDVSEIQKFFSGSKIILKKNASYDTCKRIRKKLLEVGAECLVEKESEPQTNASPAINACPKKPDSRSDPKTHQNETEMHEIENKFTKDTKKDFLSKTTQRIHFTIVGFYLITVIFLCVKYQIDPVSPIGNLLSTYVFAGIIGWIGWRIARKSDLVANLVFNLSFAFFFIAIIVSPVLKIYQGQINKTKSETNYSKLAKTDTQNSSKNSPQKENTDELSTKKLDIESVIKNHIKELGYLCNRPLYGIHTGPAEGHLT